MEETIIRYIATITVGDEFHKEGEEHAVSSWEVGRTQKEGLRLKLFENNWGDTFYNLYPCSIRKTVYKLEPIEISTIEGGDRMNCDYCKGEIACDRDDSERDWREHWP